MEQSKPWEDVDVWNHPPSSGGTSTLPEQHTHSSIVGERYWWFLERGRRKRIIGCMDRLHNIHSIEQKGHVADTHGPGRDLRGNKRPQDPTMYGQICGSICPMHRKSKAKWSVEKPKLDSASNWELSQTAMNSSSPWKPFVESWNLPRQQQCLVRHQVVAAGNLTEILRNARRNTLVLLMPTKARDQGYNELDTSTRRIVFQRKGSSRYSDPINARNGRNEESARTTSRGGLSAKVKRKSQDNSAAHFEVAGRNLYANVALSCGTNIFSRDGWANNFCTDGVCSIHVEIKVVAPPRTSPLLALFISVAPDASKKQSRMVYRETQAR